MKKWAERVLSVCTALAMVGGFGAIQSMMSESDPAPQVSAYGDDNPTTYPTYEPYRINTDITITPLKQYLLQDEKRTLYFKLHTQCKDLSGDSQQNSLQETKLEQAIKVSSSNEEVATVKFLSCKKGSASGNESYFSGQVLVEFHQVGETTITVEFGGYDEILYYNPYVPWKYFLSSKSSIQVSVSDTEQEGTTSPVNPTQEETTEPTNPPETIHGDLDEDGKSGVSDIVKLAKYLHHGEWSGNPKKADLNGDNIVNVIDLALLKRKVLQS